MYTWSTSGMFKKHKNLDRIILCRFSVYLLCRYQFIDINILFISFKNYMFIMRFLCVISVEWRYDWSFWLICRVLYSYIYILIILLSLFQFLMSFDFVDISGWRYTIIKCCLLWTPRDSSIPCFSRLWQRNKRSGNGRS